MKFPYFVRDSIVLFATLSFFLFPGEISAQTILTLHEDQRTSEGDNITLSCNYSTSSLSDTLQWYRQFPRSSPEFLLFILQQGSTSSLPPRLSAEVNTTTKRVDLIISSTAVSDSALYYCALQPTVTETHQTLY
uniref:Ig-like domain-containing protein n=1 Tax=Astyanax mexicanus TaxID=7994 RepID=A0A3B1JQK0_ASTMX